MDLSLAIKWRSVANDDEYSLDFSQNQPVLFDIDSSRPMV